MYLLDTDHIEFLQRKTQPEYPRLSRRIGMHPPATFYYPIISLHEQALGSNRYIARAKDSAGVVHGYAMLERDLADYCQAQVLPYDVAAAAEFDSLRARKVRVATMDLRIASIALARGLTVLTRNLRDFTQVPGLNVEDWTT